jgi:hypothetical protein
LHAVRLTGVGKNRISADKVARDALPACMHNALVLDRTPVLGLFDQALYLSFVKFHLKSTDALDGGVVTS